MEQVFVLLVVAVFAFLNWLVKQGASKQPPTRPGAQPLPRRPVGPPREAADDSVRELLEALGVPKANLPPSRGTPPVFSPPSRPVTAARPIPAPPPVIARPIPAPAPVVIPPAAPIFESPAPTPVVADIPAPVVPIPVPDAYAQPVPPVAASVRLLLKTPGSLRSAVILREILGPPLSLQS